MVNWVLLKNGWLWANINKNASQAIQAHTDFDDRTKGQKDVRKRLEKAEERNNRLAVIRNPYDRLVSCWANRRADFSGCDDFTDFVDYVVRTPDEEINSHARSQTYHLEPWPRLLIDFERVNEEFASLGINLQRINSSKHKHWTSYYNQWQLKAVRQRYLRDFEVWESLSDGTSYRMDGGGSP
jgi:hypothetical protein